LKVLSIIPARYGSKGFKNKNIAVIEDKTLIEWAVLVAKSSKYIGDVYISTDSKEYESIALNCGAKSLSLRPDYLANDAANTRVVISELISHLDKFDYIVLLQPTSPIRDAKQIDEMIDLLKNSDADSIVSVENIDEPHPFKLKKIKDNYLLPFMDNSTSEVPRQQLPTVYKLSGAIYVVKYDYFIKNNSLFGKTLPYITESTVNIDSELDFIFLQTLLKYKKTTLKELCNV
jgi:CMP-N,N'-diacetyllegionaminic acid synthase